MKWLLLIFVTILCVHHVTYSQCFSPSVNYPVGIETRAVTSGDFNGDNNIDLVTAKNLLSGNGAGGFTTSIISNLDNNSIYSIVSADFNNDGDLDLAMAGGAVYVLIGNGSGGFSSPSIINIGSTWAKGLAATNFNNDGKMDLVIISDNEIKVLLGNGTGGFSSITVTTLTGSPLFITVGTADFNGDGNSDLAVTKFVASSLAYLSIFIGNGTGGFSSPTDIMIGAYPQDLTIADLNNDGKADIVTSHNNALTIALGNGLGGFTANIMYNTGSYDGMTTGDFNNDGDLDLLLSAGASSAKSIWLGDGTGLYSPSSITNFDYQAYSESTSLTVVAADFNEDGKLDIGSANYSAGSVSVILGRINVTITQTDVSTCYGGNNGTATATGSCGPNFTYSWNTSPIQNSATAIGLTAGTYTVTVNQGNASDFAIVNISQPSEILLTTTSTNESCNGGGNNGSASGNVSGGIPPYTYAWNTTPVQTTETASNLTTGNYILTVTDANGCTKSSSAQVNYTPNPSSFSYTSSGMVVTFSRNGTGCNSFVWDFGNGNTSTINPNPTITYQTPGVYGVCLQCNGQPAECVQCLNITVPSNNSGTTGVKEDQNSIGITVFPNPADKSITIKNENYNIKSSFLILNSLGQHVLTGSILGETTLINVDMLSSGVYLLQVGESKKYSQKFIKQ